MQLQVPPLVFVLLQISSKDHETQINLFEKCYMFVIKGFLPMRNIESILASWIGI
jgi:hypothetical protein